MTTPKWLPETKIIKCKVCKSDVPVNSGYPITEVTCQSCYLKNKADVETLSW